MSVLLPQEIDVSKVQHTPVTVNSRGGKSSKVFYNGAEMFVQYGRLNAPFEVSEYESADNPDNKSYYLTVNFDGYKGNDGGEPTRPRAHAAFQAITKLEKNLVKHAAANSLDWLGDEQSEEVCQMFLRKSLQYTKDKTTKKVMDHYSPLMKFMFKVYDNVLKTKVYINNRESQVYSMKHVMELFEPRSEVLILARCDKVTFSAGKYGYKWVIEQLKIYLSPPSIMSSYAFKDEEESDYEQD